MLASVSVNPAKIVTPLLATAPNMDALASVHPTLSGASLRDRAIRSNLRSLALPAITAPIPRASTPFGRCALRLPGGSLRSLPLPGRHDRAKARSRRRLARPGRLRRLRASPRLVAGNGFAVHRPPHCAVQQCPRECRRFRRSARHGASHSCPRSRRRGRAAQAPRRLPSAGFPGFDFPILNAAHFGRPDRPGRPWVSHPTHP